MVTVSLQEKSGIYQVVLNYKDKDGKRKLDTKNRTKNKSSYRTLPLAKEISKNY